MYSSNLSYFITEETVTASDSEAILLNVKNNQLNADVMLTPNID
jgi:hypothetical protein